MLPLMDKISVILHLSVAVHVYLLEVQSAFVHSRLIYFLSLWITFINSQTKFAYTSNKCNSNETIKWDTKKKNLLV